MYNDYLTNNDKQKCYGCRACEEICPRKCITMEEDIETFFYPKINKEKCINCGLCHKICPANFTFEKSKNQKAVAAVHKDNDIVFGSSSGGAFTAIVNSFFDENTVVFGVCYDENLKVKHDCAYSAEDTKRFRKSKYVQSDTNGCYTKIKQMLDEGKKVLFTGTPCQVAALKAFIGNAECERLVCVDLVCHGVMSQKLFDKHISEISDKKVKEYNFRYKKFLNGKYNSRTAEIIFDDGKTIISEIKDDAYLKAYYSRLAYRPSCKTCKFATSSRVSDITIADAWGIEAVYPELNTLKGCSLIISNTKKGEILLSSLEKYMDVYDVSVEWAVANNEQLRKTTSMHNGREKFFDKIALGSTFKKSVNYALKRPFLLRVASRLKRYFVR